MLIDGYLGLAQYYHTMIMMSQCQILSPHYSTETWSKRQLLVYKFNQNRTTTFSIVSINFHLWVRFKWGNITTTLFWIIRCCKHYNPMDIKVDQVPSWTWRKIVWQTRMTDPAGTSIILPPSFRRGSLCGPFSFKSSGSKVFSWAPYIGTTCCIK